MGNKLDTIKWIQGLQAVQWKTLKDISMRSLEIVQGEEGKS